MLLLLLATAFVTASGARFPNVVERTITLKGEAAVALSALLGLSDSCRTTELPLGKRDAWAVYLLKQDTEEPLSNDNDGAPPRHNWVKYCVDSGPTLTIGPYWLDLGTQLPDRRPGYYAFGSPLIAGSDAPDGRWMHLVRQLRLPVDWEKHSPGPFRRCFDASANVEACVAVYWDKEYGDTEHNSGCRIVLLVGRRQRTLRSLLGL